MSEAALSRTICDIYNAAINPTLWTKALQSSCEFTGVSSAILFWQDIFAEHLTALHYFNVDPHFIQTYLEEYQPLNPLFPGAIFNDVGSVTPGTDIVPLAELLETRFFTEWVTPQKIGDPIMVLLDKDTRGAAFLSLQGTPLIAPDDAKRRSALLVPHFQRAVAIGRLFDKHKAVEAVLTKTLDRIDDGVFLVDGDGRIAFANARATAMLEEGDLLRGSNGLLRATAPEADRTLRDSLRAIADDSAPIGARGITLTLSDTPGSQWIANVLPLDDGARRRAGQESDAVAAIFVRRSVYADPTPLETLARDRKLTASEIRVVEAMLRISGLDAIAAALGISTSTVKTHLNHVYRKCDVKSQSELIRLVAGMGPAR